MTQVKPIWESIPACSDAPTAKLLFVYRMLLFHMYSSMFVEPVKINLGFSSVPTCISGLMKKDPCGIR